MKQDLLDEKPIVVLPSLVNKVGSLERAVMLQYLHFLVIESGGSDVGVKISDLQKQLSFWSESSIRAHLKALEEDGFIRSTRDGRSKRYSIAKLPGPKPQDPAPLGRETAGSCAFSTMKPQDPAPLGRETAGSCGFSAGKPQDPAVSSAKYVPTRDKYNINNKYNIAKGSEGEDKEKEINKNNNKDQDQLAASLSSRKEDLLKEYAPLVRKWEGVGLVANTAIAEELSRLSEEFTLREIDIAFELMGEQIMTGKQRIRSPLNYFKRLLSEARKTKNTRFGQQKYSRRKYYEKRS